MACESYNKSKSLRLTDRQTDRDGQKGLGNTVRCIACSCSVKTSRIIYVGHCSRASVIIGLQSFNYFPSVYT